MAMPIGTYAKAVVGFLVPAAVVIGGAVTAANVPGGQEPNWRYVVILAVVAAITTAGSVYTVRNKTAVDYETDGGPDAGYATEPDEPYEFRDLDGDGLDDETGKGRRGV